MVLEAPREEVRRDRVFMTNLDYLISKDDGVVRNTLHEVPDDDENPTPAGFWILDSVLSCEMEPNTSSENQAYFGC